MSHSYLPELTEVEFEIALLIKEAALRQGKQLISTARDWLQEPTYFAERFWEGAITHKEESYQCRGYLNGGGFLRCTINDRGPFELISPATLHFGEWGSRDPGPNAPSWALTPEDKPPPVKICDGWDSDVCDIGCRTLNVRFWLAKDEICRTLQRNPDETVVQRWLEISSGERPGEVVEFFKKTCAVPAITDKTESMLSYFHFTDALIIEIHERINDIYKRSPPNTLLHTVLNTVIKGLWAELKSDWKIGV